MCLWSLNAPMSRKMGQSFKTRDLDLWSSMKTFSQQDVFFKSHGTVETLGVKCMYDVLSFIYDLVETKKKMCFHIWRMRIFKNTTQICIIFFFSVFLCCLVFFLFFFFLLFFCFFFAYVFCSVSSFVFEWWLLVS